MKTFVTILVALSLYAPSVAKLLAYTDCSIQILANSNPLLCDCTKFLSDDQIPLSSDENNQQQKLSQKTDWKFTLLAKYQISNCTFLIIIKYIDLIAINLPPQRANSIFHPPSV